MTMVTNSPRSLLFVTNDQIRYIQHTFPIVSVGNDDYSGGNEILYLYIIYYIYEYIIPAYTLCFIQACLALLDSVLHQGTFHIGWTGKAPGLGI